MAALSYIGFCMLWLAAFMAGMGKNANSEKEGSLGAIGGALGFSCGIDYELEAIICDRYSRRI